MRILMHLCCANCALYPYRKLKADGMKIDALWFNPNIHPSQEYIARLGAVRELQELWKLDILYKDHYGLLEFIKSLGENTAPGVRCRICYRMRMEEAARSARELGMDAFTTSLLVSPFQKFEVLVEEAKRAEALFNIPFYLEDFRGGYREGVSVSKELGLYRQKYCGCIFSEMERFIKHSRSQRGPAKAVE
jgi:predicted adenine nucleotide alpha hydrolase (AANH) superfamily ATPase